jgi:hypothetical protein
MEISVCRVFRRFPLRHVALLGGNQNVRYWKCAWRMVAIGAENGLTDSWNTTTVIQKARDTPFEWLQLEKTETLMLPPVLPYVDAPSLRL